MNANRDAYRRRLAGLTRAELAAEATAALLAEHDSRDDAGVPAKAAMELTSFYWQAWVARGFGTPAWKTEVVVAAKAELAERRRINAIGS